MYEKGLGVPQNPEFVMNLYKEAAFWGHKESQEALKGMECAMDLTPSDKSI
jgi:TPR repeat protein